MNLGVKPVAKFKKIKIRGKFEARVKFFSFKKKRIFLEKAYNVTHPEVNTLVIFTKPGTYGLLRRWILQLHSTLKSAAYHSK